jgi:transposase InsO family protein
VDFGDIQVIIGLNNLSLIFPEDGTRVEDKKTGVCAWRTRLGWVIVGPSPTDAPDLAHVCFETLGSPVHQQLTEIFREFSSVESFGVEYKDPSDQAYDVAKDLEQMRANTTHDGTRYCTPMLWIDSNRDVPSSEEQAYRRLISLERKLQKNQVVSKMYRKRIQEDLDKEYIERLTAEEAERVKTKKRRWFLPHFAVFHPDKPEKVRRVLDAKATNSGLSLNDMLKRGPDLLNSIFEILLNFRLGRFAVNGDIKEMFPQIKVAEADKDMLLFLWRNEQGAVEVYRNLRHIFGGKCSPAVANFCLQLAGSAHPDAVVRRLVQRCFYMDDYYGSFHEMQEARHYTLEVKAAAAAGGFQLVQLQSSNHEVLEGLLPEDLSQAVKELKLHTDKVVKSKALGVIWSLSEDCFQLASRKMDAEFQNLAQYLAILASVYDPLGFFTPYTITGKILMSKVWRAVGSWQACIPENLAQQCRLWVAGLQEVSTLQVKRWYGTIRESQLWLWISADASEEAYSAVAHISFKVKDKTEVAFVAAKARLAPVNKLSIPRLELMALVMGVRLARTVLLGLEQARVSRITFLIDSRAVLGQVGKPASESRDTFVSNRVGEIHSKLDSPLFSSRMVEIRHVKSKQNPADFATRATAAEDFVKRFQDWLYPAVLQEATEQGKWFEDAPAARVWATVSQAEEKTAGFADYFIPAYEDIIMTGVETSVADPRDFDDLNKFLQQHAELGEGFTPQQLEEALLELALDLQATWFARELAVCKRANGGRALMQKGPLKGRVVFLDEKGLLRHQTRLEFADWIPWQERNPIILPPRAELTKLIVRDTHRQLYHLGYKSTRAKLRERYDLLVWSVVKEEVFHCCQCREQRPIRVQTPVAPVHADHLDFGCHPFTRTGMDYFGPFKIVGGKAYGLLFICLTSRCVHIEATRSMDEAAFLLALERFMARRSKPKLIRSDHATTFRAGGTEVTRMFNEARVKRACVEQHGIEFITNPPGAPNFGGSWERAIGTVKQCLLSAYPAAGKRLTFEGLLTVFARIEQVVNDRPIGFGDNGEAIRPSQLLNPLTPAIASLPLERSSKELVKAAGKVIKHFWRSWRQVYLHELSPLRIHGQGRFINLQVGDKVLVDAGRNKFKDEWVHGVVTEVHTQADGWVRSVTVNTTAGSFRRSVGKIAVTEEDILRRRTSLS